jgi:hypothetical protein
VGSFGVLLAALGSLNRGPLASVLYKDSVIYRGDYWFAGWKMTMDHPFFGVGLDSYGDWYRRSRTLEATLRRGPDVTSNAAHNVLLDFSSNGGFPLLFIYLLLMALVVRAAIRVIRRNPKFDPVFTGLFAVWLSYQAQSIISLNQLGLAVWGWIISGLIIGFDIYSRSPLLEEKEDTRANKKNTALAISNRKVRPATSLSLFVGFLVGLMVGLPPLLGNTRMKSALESGDPNKITKVVTAFPQDATQTIQTAIIFYENKLNPLALSTIEAAVVKYPDVFDGWKILAALGNASPEQVARAKEQMKRLDPYNPDLK